MKKTTTSILATVLVSVFIATGVLYAASHNITSTLGGVSGDFFDVDGTMIFDSIKVGAQDVGGVTFFNGTIVNDTTTSGADNPVTFGDNVRIDGRVYRGAIAGISDSLPFIVNDNMEVKGALTVDGNLTANGFTGDGIISTVNILDGTIDTADLAGDSITPDKINGTGGANLPIAYGFCDSDGSTRGGTSNISCSWNAGSSQYEITITDETYYYNDYITIVTAISDGMIASTSSVSDKLVISFIKHDSTTGQQSDFAFVVYKY